MIYDLNDLAHMAESYDDAGMHEHAEFIRARIQEVAMENEQTSSE